MKKFTTALIALSLISANVAAFEWGGKIDNSTKFEGKDIPNLKLKQKDGISLWLTSPLNKSGSVTFSTEGGYNFEYAKETDTFTNIVDLSLFKLSVNQELSSGGTILLNAGRYSISDSTGIIFNQQSDGLLFGYSTPKASISAYGGYTGLLNSKTNSLIPLETPETEKDFYNLAKKFIPYGLMLKFPSLFANQNVNVQAWGFADLNDSKINRYFATADLGGYITTKAAYKLSTSFGSKDFENISNLSSLSVTVFPCDWAIVSTGATYASGSNGDFKPFTGFTSMKSCIAMRENNYEYSDLCKFDLKAIFNVLSKASISAGTAAIFNSKVEYQGIQWQIDSNWFVYSDVQIGLSAAQFFGDNSEDDKTSLSLKASINF